MQIHVVQRGQTLYGISQAYGVPVEALVEANGLQNQQALAVGQALVIPVTGRFHWVSTGQSLYSIGTRYGVSAQELARVNQLDPARPLPVGLRLYIPPRPRRPVEVNAYVEPRGTEVSEALQRAARQAAPNLTYLAPFSFQIQRDGSLKAPPLDALPQIAREAGATPMLVVTNLEEDQFSTELGHVILTDEAVQDRLLNSILETARQYGFRDVHFDFEKLPPEDRQAYNSFLRKAANRIHGAGYLISTALAPKTSAEQAGVWYTAHDYKAHGQIADFVVIMTYEWGYSGGPAQPVSPIGPVRKVLQYALSELPGRKIMMGQNLYGYDWTLPFVRGGQFARALSPVAATEQAVKYGVPIEYDYEAQAPHYRYVDEAGKTHEVWFEDARSIQAKFDLLRELGLRGISYWKLGLPFPQNWLLLEDTFTVTKR